MKPRTYYQIEVADKGTGQVTDFVEADFYRCDLYDYPDLLGAQKQMLALAKKTTTYLRQYRVVEKTVTSRVLGGSLGRIEFASAMPRSSKKKVK